MSTYDLCRSCSVEDLPLDGGTRALLLPSHLMGEGLGGGDDRKRSITLPLAPSRQGRGDF